MGLLICRLISFIAIDSIIIDCIGRSAFKVRGWKRTWQRWMLPTLEFFFFSFVFRFVLFRFGFSRQFHSFARRNHHSRAHNEINMVISVDCDGRSLSGRVAQRIGGKHKLQDVGHQPDNEIISIRSFVSSFIATINCSFSHRLFFKQIGAVFFY